MDSQKYRRTFSKNYKNSEDFLRYFMCAEPHLLEKAPPKKQKRISAKKNVQQFFLGEPLSHLYLTPRELDCMLLLLQGLTNFEVGKQLNLSARTIEFYIKNMRQKLGCHNKAHLIETIRKSGFANNLFFNQDIQLKQKTVS